MQVETLVPLQPGLHVGVLVGGVVVQDQMDLEVARDLGVDGLEERQELLVAVSGRHCPMIVPVSTSNAANKAVVPWRL